MNRQKLLGILESPKDISDKDLEELESAVQQYPYFQLGYALIAKAKYDRQSPDAYDSLSMAAVYAPDRSTLKKIFYDNLSINTHGIHDTEDLQTVADTPEEIITDTENLNQTEEDTTATLEPEVVAIESETIAEPDTEVETVAETDTEIETVAETDTESETIAEPDEDPVIAATTDETQIVEEVEDEETISQPVSEELASTEATVDDPEVEEVENKHEDDAFYQELEENLKNLRENKLKFDDEEEENTESSDKKKTIIETETPEDGEESLKISAEDDQNTPVTENLKPKPVREKGTSRLITEISLLEPLPVDQDKTKQQSQLQLIDKFIDTEPQIVYNDQNTLYTQVSDLSEKSVPARDYLLTENFAAIMQKQGKIDKAIEIYRKLIWKFPQKKAYFAARIKALKESE